MAIGMLIWNTTNCLTGWAGGRGILFSRVKSETGPTEKEDVTSGEDERSGSYRSTERLTDEEPPTDESTRRKHDEEESGDIEKDKGVTRSGREGTRRIIQNRQNRPSVPPYIVLPSLIAGILWAIATTSFFVANQYLSQAISFPIITMLPGCVVSAWSILYFHEIKGSRNLKILAVAMVVTLIGAVMVGLSKFVHL
ncbi:hypothetical protein TELCIR_05450 [Teladorsagia circumcincta]|uniref:Uncharacterized protein n=1 Tax=Teladorsagia circumcincta TaxID=45464 RepID=A0A2G9UQP5_TELCI|nr:hypothetical protein TELCIR_05450 [Teladorsagia circumcincta]